MLRLIGLALSLVVGVASAKEVALPSPLTLDKALALSDALPVSVMNIAAERAQLAAERFDGEKAKRLRLTLEGEAALLPYFSDYYHYIQTFLVARKVLYDGGRSQALRRSLDTLEAALKAQASVFKMQYRLKVVEAFFKIVLADLRFRQLNEEMAVVYVTLDAMRDRHRLGSVSDVELADQEKRYGKLLLERAEAELAQRQHRLELAILLNQPDALIDEVAPPKVADLQWEPLPDVSVLLRQLPYKSPALLALKQKLAAFSARQKWVALQKAPTLSAEVGVGPRYLESELDVPVWTARLKLNWPIVDGGAQDAERARVEAKRLAVLAEYKRVRQQLEKRVVHLWKTLSLRTQRKKWLESYQAFVDLNMEYKRGLYENEEKTDIGDAMIEQSRYDYAALEALFEALMARYELKTIMGELWP